MYIIFTTNNNLRMSLTSLSTEIDHDMYIIEMKNKLITHVKVQWL